MATRASAFIDVSILLAVDAVSDIIPNDLKGPFGKILVSENIDYKLQKYPYGLCETEPAGASTSNSIDIQMNSVVLPGIVPKAQAGWLLEACT